MKKHILFLQGGAGDDDHAADAKMAASLKRALCEGYLLHYPVLPEEQAPDFGRMKQVADALRPLEGEIIIVAHSLGASMLLKYLSENRQEKDIAGIFLIATPFWKGDEDWKQGLKLREDFANKIPEGLPVFLYHARDDEEVPFGHLDFYAKKMPWAKVREIEKGGHQLDDDLSIVAKDIASL